MKFIFRYLKMIIILSATLLLSCNSPHIPLQQPSIMYAQAGVVLDALPNDEIWEMQAWEKLDQVWLGNTPDSTDFKGKYKLAWDEKYLYVLAEITDDTLMDIHTDPLEKYWDDDCLEVFIDEDASGGNHQYSYNAFAYHIALNGDVADIAPDSSKVLLNDHAIVKRQTTGNTTIWEVAFQLYDSTFTHTSAYKPISLTAGKKLGFMIAYCDNDRSAERENFVGSVAVNGTDKNRGWIDAGIFGKYELIK